MQLEWQSSGKSGSGAMALTPFGRYFAHDNGTWFFGKVSDVFRGDHQRASDLESAKQAAQEDYTTRLYEAQALTPAA